MEIQKLYLVKFLPKRCLVLVRKCRVQGSTHKCKLCKLYIFYLKYIRSFNLDKIKNINDSLTATLFNNKLI